MDRRIIYTGQIPLDTDQLQQNQDTMAALGFLADAILGSGTAADGLACTPTTPASMSVTVAKGSIYGLQNLESTAYGSVAADTTRQVVKQGIARDAQNFACPAPGTTGHSIVYLIQAAYQDADGGAAVLPYYNASNPSQAYAGPNNTGVSQNTVRRGACVVQVKAGVSATTGTQATPAPDAGFAGLHAITVANGATTITGGNIARVAGAPFVDNKLRALAPLAGPAFTGVPTAPTAAAGTNTDQIATMAALKASLAPVGQCRLTLSGGDLLLSRHNGNRILVNDTLATIPSAGVSLAATGLTPGTLYYIYAYVTGGVLTLEASASVPVVGTASGLFIKSGDATRTLVGMAQPIAGPAWADVAKQRLVLSHFNRRALDLSGDQVTTTTTSAPGVELSASARAEFLNWNDEVVSFYATAICSNSTASGSCNLFAGLDGTTQIGRAGQTSHDAPGRAFSTVALGNASPAIGYHYLTAIGSVNMGTGTYINVAVTATIRG